MGALLRAGDSLADTTLDAYSPPVGVPGYVNRWAAEDIAVAVGGQLPADYRWASRISDAGWAPWYSAGTPTVEETAGRRYLNAPGGNPRGLASRARPFSPQGRTVVLGVVTANTFNPAWIYQADGFRVRYEQGVGWHLYREDGTGRTLIDTATDTGPAGERAALLLSWDAQGNTRIRAMREGQSTTSQSSGFSNTGWGTDRWKRILTIGQPGATLAISDVIEYDRALTPAEEFTVLTAISA